MLAELEKARKELERGGHLGEANTLLLAINALARAAERERELVETLLAVVNDYRVLLEEWNNDHAMNLPEPMSIYRARRLMEERT